MPDPIYVVCNPQAGRGRGRRLLPALLEALRGHGLEVEHGQTRAAGEEAALAAEAIARGHRTLAIMGGDGTWSNAAAAVIASGQPVRVGLVPAGTGADLARSFSIPRDMEGCARVLAGGHTRAIDAGLVEGRPFLNVAGFGYDVAVIEDTRRVSSMTATS